MKFTLENFLSKIDKYAFKIKDGLCVLPFLANSPKLIFDSMISMPFTKYDDAMKCHSANNIFISGRSYFHELEEGLWVYFSELDNKVSFEHKMLYDDKLSADYYVLSYNIVTRDNTKKFVLVNGVPFNNYSWNILKPKSVSSVIYFKDTKIKTMGLYISQSWMKDKLVKYPNFTNSNFETFFKSLVKKNIWQELQHEVHSINTRLEEIITLLEPKKRKQELHKWANHFINIIIKDYPSNHNLLESSSNDADIHRKMAKVENKLIQNLLGVFPGIEKLASFVNISPTKLKTDFKIIYGESVYQYFLNKKLDYALVLLKTKKYKVKEVSKIMNYENDVNFTRVFKARYHMLPSEIK